MAGFRARQASPAYQEMLVSGELFLHFVVLTVSRSANAMAFL